MIMKKFNAVLLLTILASTFVVVGCSGGAAEETSTNAPVPASDAHLQKEQGTKSIKPDAN